MPLLTIREGARSVARIVQTEEPLDALCPSPPPVPYARGWTVRPEGDALALVSPEGIRQGTLSPGAALTLGSLTFGVEEEPSIVGDTQRGTERLQHHGTPSLALQLPGARALALGHRPLTIGKNTRCDVVVEDSAVSGLHCRIIPTRDGWIVRDAGSTNGTFIGAARVESALLTPGITLSIGRTRIAVVRETRDALADESRIGIEGVLVGDSPGLAAVRSAIIRHAGAPYPVLIRGETGAGKELVARMIHDQSPRARGPFVAINAAAIAPDLVESELFGHERGAFTGALTRRRGVFEESSGGTLFLDEIGELPLAQQAKLLRVLETHEVRRIGGEGNVRVDLRIVSATHRDLAKRVADGQFRADLFFRLNILPITLPSLRERTDDIAPLARHLLARIAGETGRARKLDDAALAALMKHPWPGNVRELYGVLCRAVTEAESERIGIEHLEIDGHRVAPFAPVSYDAALESHARHQTPTSLLPEASDHAPRESGVFVPQPPPLPRDLAPDRLRILAETYGGNLSRLARATGRPRSTRRDRLKRT